MNVITSRSISSSGAVNGRRISGIWSWSARERVSFSILSSEVVAMAIAATPSLCKLVNRWGKVSSRRCNCESASSASSPPRTRSNAGRRALIRVAHVTRRSKPSPPATSCASRGMSNERMLRTDAEEIGDVEIFITHAKREARLLSPRC